MIQVSSAKSALVLATLGAALVVSIVTGCAQGTDPEGVVGESELATLPVEAGDENSVVLPPSTKPSEEESTDDAGAETDAGTGGTGTDSGTGGGTDAGADSGTGGGGGTTACASPNVCTGATDLGSVSGDNGSDVKTAQGSGSQWFKVRVTENDSSVFGTSLASRFELVSPAGSNFDLYVYLAGGGSGQECSAVSKSSVTTGADSTSLEWGEGTVSNGSSDDRTVSVEVRWVSGTCAPTAKWSLTVRGNAL